MSAIKYRRSNPYPTKNHGGVIVPEILVMHTTEGGGKAWLDGAFAGRDSGYKLSVHWCIYKDGEIVEYAPWQPGKAVQCFHAGESKWNGRSSCNKFSLGYEIQHAYGEPYPEAQVRAILHLNALVKKAYPNIKLITHAEIARPLGRKSDPTRPWTTDVWPRVKEAWEDTMPVTNIDPRTAKEAEADLAKIGLIDSPGKRNYDDSVGWGLVLEMLRRIAREAGLLPKP
jgi:N-acetyl-anhydromuramyl-L-alanine amidase AmpD